MESIGKYFLGFCLLMPLATIASSAFAQSQEPELTQAAPVGQVLAEIKSDPLRDIVRAMLKYSNNLTAEMVGLAATYARAGAVNSLAASAASRGENCGSGIARKRALVVDVREHGTCKGEASQFQHVRVALHKAGAEDEDAHQLREHLEETPC